jgi:hypothetical protein
VVEILVGGGVVERVEERLVVKVVLVLVVAHDAAGEQVAAVLGRLGPVRGEADDQDPVDELVAAKCPLVVL